MRTQLDAERIDRDDAIAAGRGSRDPEVQDLRLQIGAERDRADKAEARLAEAQRYGAQRHEIVRQKTEQLHRAEQRADKAVTLAEVLADDASSCLTVAGETLTGLNMRKIRARLAELRTAAPDQEASDA